MTASSYQRVDRVNVSARGGTYTSLLGLGRCSIAEHSAENLVSRRHRGLSGVAKLAIAQLTHSCE